MKNKDFDDKILDEEIRAFFKRAHQDLDPPTPAFRSIVERSVQEVPQGNAIPGAGFFNSWLFKVGAPIGGLAGALFLALGLWSQMNPTRTDPDVEAALLDAEILQITQSISSWESSFEFLDRVPGSAILETYPEFYSVPDLSFDVETLESTRHNPEKRNPESPAENHNDC